MLNNKTTHKVMFTFNFLGADGHVKEAILLIPAVDENMALHTVLSALSEYLGPQEAQEVLKATSTNYHTAMRIPEKLAGLEKDKDGYDPLWSRYYC